MIHLKNHSIPSPELPVEGLRRLKPRRLNWISNLVSMSSFLRFRLKILEFRLSPSATISRGFLCSWWTGSSLPLVAAALRVQTLSGRVACQIWKNKDRRNCENWNNYQLERSLHDMYLWLKSSKSGTLSMALLGSAHHGHPDVELNGGRPCAGDRLHQRTAKSGPPSRRSLLLVHQPPSSRRGSSSQHSGKVATPSPTSSTRPNLSPPPLLSPVKPSPMMSLLFICSPDSGRTMSLLPPLSLLNPTFHHQPKLSLTCSSMKVASLTRQTPSLITLSQSTIPPPLLRPTSPKTGTGHRPLPTLLAVNEVGAVADFRVVEVAGQLTLPGTQTLARSVKCAPNLDTRQWYATSSSTNSIRRPRLVSSKLTSLKPASYAQPSWYLDSVATHHYTPDISNLRLEKHPYHGTEHVALGDDSTIPIINHGQADPGASSSRSR